MQVFNHDDLRMHINVTLRLMGGNLGHERVSHAATDAVLRILDRALILMPDDVSTPGTMGDMHRRHGKFGETEPWPVELPKPGQRRRRPVAP